MDDECEELDSDSDLSIDLNPLQSTMEFDEVWTGLVSIVGTVLVGGQVERKIWNERVADVYYLCLAQEKPFGQKLYRELKEFFEKYVTELRKQKLFKLLGADLLSEYWNVWQPFCQSLPYLNHLFGVLNSQVIKKYKNNQLNIDYSRLGIDFDDHMMPIGELMLDVWENKMIRPQKHPLVRALLHEIQRARYGDQINDVPIKGVISSFIAVRELKTTNQLRLYQDFFEIPLFKETTEFLVTESKRLLDRCDCSEFMARVVELIHGETVRCEKFFHWSTVNKLLIDCHQHLLRDNLPYLESHCRQKVQREKWHDLHNMFILLSPLEEGLETLLEEFEEHLSNVALAVMQSLQGDNLAMQFVESMLNFHKMYTERIQAVFLSHQDFMDALDKACLIAINFKRHPKATCRSPELLSKYCDDLLKKTAKGLSETEMDEKLNQIMTLFQYLDDKDLFQKFYSRSLAKRLIMGHYQSMDIEEAMINRLKHVCGYDYTSKLHRMFTDMNISFDLDSNFSDYLHSEGKRLPHNFSIIVLQAGAWPISQANLPTFTLSLEFEKSVQLFEQFYKYHYTGRKLTWMNNLSHVEVKFICGRRTYVITTEMFAIGVLLIFNHTETASYSEIRDTCELPNKTLLKHLQMLIDANILMVTQGSLTEHSILRVNLQFTSKRLKLKILPLNFAESVQEVVQTHIAVEEDRRMFIQAAIVRIMKARRELKHAALIQEVIDQSRHRFTPKIVTIKKCVEVLLEKQYIERSMSAPENYIYIA